VYLLVLLTSRHCRHTYLRVVVLDGDFLLADSAPELDSELGDVLLVVLHTLDGQAEESLLHIEAHLVVVETHDSVQAAVCALLDAVVVGLSGLTDDLHNVVALAFVIEVGADELERVTKSSDGGISDVGVGLFLSRALDNSGEDGVGVLGETISKILVLSFADETDGGERCLLLVVGALANVLHQSGHELGPLLAGNLDSGD